MLKLFFLLLTVSAVARLRALPFLSLAVAAAVFGAGAGLSLGMIGKSFGNGFGEAASGAGIAVLAAAMIAALAGEATTPVRRVAGLWPVVGLLAGIAAAPALALAFLRPLLGGGRRAALGLGFAMSGAHGLVLPSPVLVAAVAIVGADWRLVTLAGLPCAVLAAAVGACAARIAVRGEVPVRPAPHLALVWACWGPVALLMVQSLGYVPSEPLGGGGSRELLLGAGRPLILLLFGVGIMAAAAWRRAGGDWASRGVHNAAALALTVGAAGGLQAVTGASRIGEIWAEPVAGWHVGLLAPFGAALLMKVLQGSSLTAAITAAGMVAPLLPGLGLGGEGGRAAAALAVGAGAVAGAQINDPFFWILADGATLAPARGLAFITLGTMAQGLAVLPVLLVVAAM